MAATKAPRRSRAKDLQGIRLRGGSYQVRVYDGRDPETGKQVVLTGSAQDEPGAIRLRNRFRADIAGNKSPRTTGTVGALLTTWLDQHPADAQTVDDYRFLAESFIIPALGEVRLTRLTQPGPSLIEKFYTDLRRCRRRCDRKPFIEHRRDCPSATDPDYRCDKRRNFVSAIERGAQGLDAWRLGLTADALGVDLDWLLNGPDQNVTDAAPVPD